MRKLMKFSRIIIHSAVKIGGVYRASKRLGFGCQAGKTVKSFLTSGGPESV